MKKMKVVLRSVRQNRHRQPGLNKLLTGLCAMNELGQKKASKGGATKRRASTASTKKTAFATNDDANLWVATWNTDGLSADTAVARADEICAILMESVPRDVASVVCLQEVTPVTAPVFINRLRAGGYMLLPDQGEDDLVLRSSVYFTLLFMRMDSGMNLKRSSRISFDNSIMGRDLVEIRCSWKGINLMFMHSHLESLAQGSEARVQQFREVLEKMHAFDGIAFYAGDTNIRAAEEAKLSDLYSKHSQLLDSWEVVGSPKDLKFTWDMTLNDNLAMEGSFLPRMRLDRILVKQEGNVQVCKDSFRFMGKDKSIIGAEKKSMFPSDHFGILCGYRVSRKD
jgi:endonuclease/exonuclease/phosphatase family metal-dependent hydrolase